MSDKSRRIPLNEVSHVAICGTEISPGDYVIASVTGMGQGSVHVGIYRGKYPSGSIAVDVQTVKNVLVHKDTREKYNFQLEREEVPCPTYYDANGKYIGYQPDAWKAYCEAIKARKVDYELEKRPHDWRTVLQNNQVYSLATIADVKRL